MPRRPRPASRHPPGAAASKSEKIPVELSENFSDQDSIEDSEADEEENADAPRVAQWVDEDDLEEEGLDSDLEEGPSKKSNLVSMPLLAVAVQF